MRTTEDILMSLLEDVDFAKRFCYGCPEKYTMPHGGVNPGEEICLADFCIDTYVCVRNDRWQRIVDAVDAATADCPEEAI